MSPGQLLGKYRGVVTNNRDPERLGRVRARVADVLGGAESGWALPAVPYAGSGVGAFLIPPVNTLVWIEFEHGDTDYPIWTGCFWASDDVPATAGDPDVKVIATDACTLTLEDGGGDPTITLTVGGVTISMDSAGVSIDASSGEVKVNGTHVSVNDGALDVT